MEAIGHRYLVQAQLQKKEEKIGDIIIPQTAADRALVYFIGTVIGHGTGLKKDKITDLVDIGTRIIFDYKNKSDKIKLMMNDKIYYIIDPDDVLAVINE